MFPTIRKSSSKISYFGGNNISKTVCACHIIKKMKKPKLLQSVDHGDSRLLSNQGQRERGRDLLNQPLL